MKLGDGRRREPRVDALVRFTATVRLIRRDTGEVDDRRVHPGDFGLYLGPHPHPRMRRWHLVAVRRDGERLLCPCGIGQFEVVE